MKQSILNDFVDILHVGNFYYERSLNKTATRIHTEYQSHNNLKAQVSVSS